MAHHVLAVFKTAQESNTAVDRLIESGVSQSAISILVGEGFRSEHLGVESGTKGPEGAATGATIGGVLGAIAAGLAATGTVVATGGAILVAGPVAAALAGAGAGGAAGGVPW